MECVLYSWRLLFDFGNLKLFCRLGRFYLFHLRWSPIKEAFRLGFLCSVKTKKYIIFILASTMFESRRNSDNEFARSFFCGFYSRATCNRRNTLFSFWCRTWMFQSLHQHFIRQLSTILMRQSLVGSFIFRYNKKVRWQSFKLLADSEKKFH